MARINRQPNAVLGGLKPVSNKDTKALRVVHNAVFPSWSLCFKKFDGAAYMSFAHREVVLHEEYHARYQDLVGLSTYELGLGLMFHEYGHILYTIDDIKVDYTDIPVEYHKNFEGFVHLFQNMVDDVFLMHHMSATYGDKVVLGLKILTAKEFGPDTCAQSDQDLAKHGVNRGTMSNYLMCLGYNPGYSFMEHAFGRDYAMDYRKCVTYSNAEYRLAETQRLARIAFLQLLDTLKEEQEKGSDGEEGDGEGKGDDGEGGYPGDTPTDGPTDGPQGPQEPGTPGKPGNNQGPGTPGESDDSQGPGGKGPSGPSDTELADAINKALEELLESLDGPLDHTAPDKRATAEETEAMRAELREGLQAADRLLAASLTAEAMATYKEIDRKYVARNLMRMPTDYSLSMVQLFRKLQMTNKPVTQRGLNSGRVDTNQMWRSTETTRIFNRRLPAGKQYTMAFTQVIDVSGSVFESRYQDSVYYSEVYAVNGTAKVLDALKIPHSIMAFATGFGDIKRFNDTYDLNNNMLLEVNCYGTSSPGYVYDNLCGGTAPAACLAVAVKELRKRKEDIKVLIMQTDGNPAYDDIDKIRAILAEAKRHGIVVITIIFTTESQDIFQYIYGEGELMFFKPTEHRSFQEQYPKMLSELLHKQMFGNKKKRRR